MFFPILPEDQAAGIAFYACVRHVKDILDTWIPVIDMDKGNALRATPHITAHFLRPDVKACDCGGLWVLGVDQELVGEWVLVQARCCGKKPCPAFQILCKPSRCLSRKLDVSL